MHAEHKQYIFKAITKTFDKPESLAISTISQKHLYQRFMVNFFFYNNKILFANLKCSNIFRAIPQKAELIEVGS